MKRLRFYTGSIPVLIALFYIALLTPLMGRKKGYTVDATSSYRLTQAIVETGQPFPKVSVKQGYTYSIVYLPFYAFGDTLCRFAPAWNSDWVRRKCMCWMNTVITGMTVGLLSLAIGRLGFSPTAQTAIPMLYGLSTLAFCYARYDYNKSLAAFLLLLGFYGAIRFFATRRDGFAWLCGIAVGLLVTVRLEMGIVIPVLLYGMARQPGPPAKRLKRCLGVMLPCLIGAGFVLFYNWFYWGGSAAGGYEGGFTLNPFPAVSGFLFSPGKNIWFFNPILLMLFLSVRPFHTRQPIIASLWAGMVGALFMLYCFWGNWWGGWGFGPRHLVPLLPLAVIPLAAVVDGETFRFKVWLGILGLAGCAVQLLGSGIDFNDVILTLMKHHGVLESQLIWNFLWNPILQHSLFIRHLPFDRMDFGLIGLWVHFSPAWGVGILIIWLTSLFALGSAVLSRLRKTAGQE